MTTKPARSVNETPENIANKISRGKFTAVLILCRHQVGALVCAENATGLGFNPLPRASSLGHPLLDRPDWCALGLEPAVEIRFA